MIKAVVHILATILTIFFVVIGYYLFGGNFERGDGLGVMYTMCVCLVLLINSLLPLFDIE